MNELTVQDLQRYISLRRCLLKATRKVFLEAAQDLAAYLPEGSNVEFMVPTHIWPIESGFDQSPFCLEHTFATVKYLGSDIQKAFNGSCFNSESAKYQVVVASCAPPPPSLRPDCDVDAVYGSPADCSDSLIIKPPNHASECVKPVLNSDNTFDWPDGYETTVSLNEHADFVAAQRWVLEKYYLSAVCDCLTNCANLKQTPKISVDSVKGWSDGAFEGSAIVVTVRNK